MKNEVWEKILQYLNQLRGEQKSRNSTVYIPGMAEVEKDMVRIREECGQLIEALPESEKQKTDTQTEETVSAAALPKELPTFRSPIENGVILRTHSVTVPVFFIISPL